MQTQPFDTIAEKYASSDISVILFTEEKIFTVATLKKTPLNDRLYEHVSSKKDMATKRLRTRCTFSQSLMASVGELQMAYNRPVSYLSITESLVMPVVVT